MTGRRVLTACLAALPLLVAACGGSSANQTPPPAQVEQIAGTGAMVVVLSPDSVRRLELRTAPTSSASGVAVIPYTALLYDPSGRPSVYVRTAPRTFERRMVVVSRVTGSRAYLAGGLSPGTQVATVGAPELQGIELEAGGGNMRPTVQVFDPGAFGDSAAVDNHLMPLAPGMQFIFEGRSNDGQKRLVFTVTDLVKVVGGVRNAVVWDRDYTDGELVEAELAFFAQDNVGNVWHTGEYPEEYENGKIVKTPAWLVGVNGARAGIEMPADPRRGRPAYEQGYAPPPVNWTDHAQIYRTGTATCVPASCYRNVLITREYNPGEQGSQLKYFAPGVGNIRVGWLGKDADREGVKLVKIVRLAAAGLAAARAKALELDSRAYRLQKAVYGATPRATRR